MCLSNKLAEICSHQQDRCAILITCTPPDKSMLLCFDATNQLAILYESHSHFLFKYSQLDLISFPDVCQRLGLQYLWIKHYNTSIA